MELLLRPWKMYADANGRSTPAEFWLFYVTKYAVFIALLVLAGGFASLTASQVAPLSMVFATLAIVWILGSLMPSVVLLVRRCHDFNTTGKWALLTFVPYLGFIAVIVIGVIPGTRGENERGFDPREPDPYEVASAFE